jgi:hypothetical protein
MLRTRPFRRFDFSRYFESVVVILILGGSDCARVRGRYADATVYVAALRMGHDVADLR